MNNFIRKNRYLVIKRSDIDSYLTDKDKKRLHSIARSIEFSRKLSGRGSLKSVVVGHDWPEYEDTWKTIEHRIAETGVTPE